eukprot:15183367-Alexandrium_andersonii.AAC.1
MSVASVGEATSKMGPSAGVDDAQPAGTPSPGRGSESRRRLGDSTPTEKARSTKSWRPRKGT